MIPARFGPVLFSVILSGLMSLLVAGISTLRSLGLHEGFAPTWIAAWLTAWLVAFPAVLVIAPLTQRLVRAVCHKPGDPDIAAHRRRQDSHDRVATRCNAGGD